MNGHNNLMKRRYAFRQGIITDGVNTFITGRFILNFNHYNE
jgi:hypothetical protein